MSTASAIEWTDATWNPVRGCARVSAGCERCYAERVAYRFGQKPGSPYEGLTTLGKHGPRWAGSARFVPDMLGEPLSWRRPRRVFVNSMSDLFHEDITNEQVAAVFGVMAATPRHTYQVLTKRPARMLRWFDWLRLQWLHDAETFGPPPPVECGIHAANYCADVDYLGLPATWPLPNVWLGVSCEDQQAADARIPLLLDCPAAVRFVSIEPLLEALSLYAFLPGAQRDECLQILGASGRVPSLDWVIVGGESGPSARPCRVSWLESVVQQCAAARVPCFVKQLGTRPWDDTRARGVDVDMQLTSRKGGDPSEWPVELRVRQWPEVSAP